MPVSHQSSSVPKPLKTFKVRDTRIYLQAASTLSIKNLTIAASDEWLTFSAVVTVILAKDIFIIRSILIDAEVSVDNISFLGD